MKYCKRCVLPDTRKDIKFDENGVCYPCLHTEKKKTTDWSKRWIELVNLAQKYRRINGSSYDCIIAVSAGKDSFFQTHIFKNELGMNPLLVNVSNISSTHTGEHNFRMLNEQADIHSINLNREVVRIMTTAAFELMLRPNWYYDRAIYIFPLQLAIKLNIPLVVYGENANVEYGGILSGETPDARNQINNNVVKNIDWQTWIDKTNLSMQDFSPCILPSPEEMNKIQPIYLSYYLPWDGFNNLRIAKKYGFQTLEKEWNRAGYIDNYEQIDTIGYNINYWFKFLRLGTGKVTGYCNKQIRLGRMLRQEAVQHVNEEDWKLDPKMHKDFLDFTRIKDEHFWEIVNKHANKEILEKHNGVWKLKQPCH